MNNIEIIYREILHLYFTEKTREFTQKALARRLDCSVSTVFHALEIPRRTGAIKVTGRNFALIDAERLLVFWATRRRLNRETLFQTHAEGSAAVREGLMPPDVIFGAYSAYRLRYGTAPADYE